MEYITKTVKKWTEISLYEDFNGLEITLQNNNKKNIITMDGLIDEKTINLIYKMKNLKTFKFQSIFHREYTNPIFTDTLNVKHMTIHKLTMISINSITKCLKSLEIVYFHENHIKILYNILKSYNIQRLDIIIFENEYNIKKFKNWFRNIFPNIKLNMEYI